MKGEKRKYSIKIKRFIKRVRKKKQVQISVKREKRKKKRLKKTASQRKR